MHGAEVVFDYKIALAIDIRVKVLDALHYSSRAKIALAKC